MRRVLDGADRSVGVRRAVIEVHPEDAGRIGRSGGAAQIEQLVLLRLRVVDLLELRDDAGVSRNERQEERALLCVLERLEDLTEIARRRRRFRGASPFFLGLAGARHAL